MIVTEKDIRELEAWRAGPWVLKRDHEALVAKLRDQLTKCLDALVDAERKNQALDEFWADSND